MSAAAKHTTEAPRDYARRVAGQGVGLLAHAINFCSDNGRNYRYVDRDRFERLMFALVVYLEEGEIEELTTAPSAGEHDPALQRFLRGLAGDATGGRHAEG